MLRRFRTWLADIIRPVEVQPAPAPVVVAPEPTAIYADPTVSEDSDKSTGLHEINDIQQVALSILEDRSLYDRPVIRKTKSGHTTKGDQLIKTKVFADMCNVSESQIIKWKNGITKSPSFMPKHIRSGEKSPTMWNREECLVFAYIYSKSTDFNDCFIDSSMLSNILGTTYPSAYSSAKHWSARNRNRSSWHQSKDGRRLLKLSHAIEIGLERAGLAV